MPICQHCGVEVEMQQGPCPLCKHPLDQAAESLLISEAGLPDTKPLSTAQKVTLFWELSTILHFSALVVTLLIDLIINKKLTWSLYTITSIVASFNFITLLCFAVKRLWIFLPGLLINALGLLLLLDLYHNGIEWFVNPGLPLAGFFVLLLGMVMIFGYRTRQRGFNIIGAASLAVGIYCILTETFISLALHEPVSLSWSVIVAASLLPFSLLLMYYHYRLKRGTSLRKFFHL